MAVPNNYIDKIKKDGDSRMISPAADMVRVDNDNFEGTDLDEVLDEVAQAIGEAGEAGYAPPAGGIPKTDLASDVQTSLGKADTALQSFTETDPTVPSWAKAESKPTYTAQEVGALPASTTIPTKVSDLTNDSGFTSNAGTITGITMNGASKGTSGVVDLGTVITAHQDISGKANASDVYTKTQTDTLLAGKLSKSDVSVETQGDGTVDINVKDDTYTINLNHTHENMAKLIVCEESDLPSTLDPATIYAQVNDASNPTEIEVLYIAGLEFAGGGVPAGTPAITKPSGTTINLGENSGSGVSKTIEIKANSHITGDLTVALAANSDLSFDTSNLPSGVTYNSGAGTLTIEQLPAIQGVNITIVYSGSGAAEIDGGLIITGGGASPKSVVVVVAEPPYFPEGFLADTAWERAGEELDYPDSVQGYCTNPFTSQFAVAHDSSHKYDLIIKGGFVKNNGELTRGKTMFKLSLSASKTNAAYTHSSDPLRLNDTDNRNHLYNYVSATFKTSEIDNCYIYDNVAHVYLWAGKNVDTSVAPTIPNS